jgi:hypothetical protein
MEKSSRTLEMRAAFLAVLLFALHTGSAQEVYKSVDADGHVVYSDRGSTRNAPKTTLHVDEGNAAEAARLAREQRQLNAEDAQRTRQEAAEAQNKSAEAKQRQKACQNARNNYLRLKDSGRLFRSDADGNRIYYSDEEADALRAQAKQAMTAACAS